MREYELMVLLHPDLEIDVDTPVSKIEKLVEDLGGKVIKRDNWGKKKLAYAIRKLDFAIYVLYHVRIEPDKVNQLEKSLLLTEEVIRHLIISPQVSKRADDAKAKAAASAAKVKEGAKEETDG